MLVDSMKINASCIKIEIDNLVLNFISLHLSKYRILIRLNLILNKIHKKIVFHNVVVQLNSPEFAGLKKLLDRTNPISNLLNLLLLL
jgi:hypothetical protein